ncbi:BglII/BstYI family type II restriction endonuclease [Bacillus tropicus]|uniref:BglII/BstYI family type II restriction endonuclease n=1 Tax=Bacillus shihchuchen TaxID=3036942 RepID=A0ABT7KZT0_9BACI|nr:BglII/BstYI family type II restriction endonuclease [Bacillus tropicus]MDL2418868.1 BglII/BstYI family type II restriction endonuclease [Bacillus shihchuchen]WBO92313.1 BglII/BstYI family type II restriction endonuclease [Bacillus tropicus]
MKVETYSYRYAEEILQHPRFEAAYNELMMVCRDCPVPIYKGKSNSQSQLEVMQQIMNTYFLLRFEELGWEKEPRVTPNTSDDALRSDFRKYYIDSDTGEVILKLQIEVEFGNVASSYRNYFKFQLSFSYDLVDICILIVPSYELCKRIDSGVSNYEKTIREIPAAKLSVTVPTLVIGLFDDGSTAWNVKDITEDLKVLKGATKDTYAKHCQIVQRYINDLKV